MPLQACTVTWQVGWQVEVVVVPGYIPGPERGGTGIAGMQVYGVISSCRISWEEATLRRKALPLLMEWDATRPHTQVHTPQERLAAVA